MGECVTETGFANSNPDFTIPPQQPGRSQESPGCCDCSSNRTATVNEWLTSTIGPLPDGRGTALRRLSN